MDYSRSPAQDARGLGQGRKQKKGSGKTNDRHCDTTQLLLKFEAGKKLGEVACPEQGNPTTPGSGQDYKEHQPCYWSRHLVGVSDLRGQCLRSDAEAEEEEGRVGLQQAKGVKALNARSAEEMFFV